MSSVIEQIKKQIDIVDVVSEYIDLSKKGRNFWALCPFHEDSNPSMSVSPDKQMFKCFVCGTGGDAIKFVSDYEKISFPEALSKLGEKVGVKVDFKKNNGPSYSEKEKEMLDVIEEAMNFFQYSLVTQDGAKALEYAESRKLNQKIREEFLIGYAPQKGLKEFLVKKGYDVSLLINAGLLNQRGKDFFRDRLIFGLSNEFNKVVGFSARDLSGKSQAKYINSPENKLFSKSNTLYNFGNAKEIIRKEKNVFINEGFMDVIAMNRAGFRNSVAIMGTALTREHIKYLKGKIVVLMLDSDKAGINATIKSIKILLNSGIDTKVVNNSEAKDPDELIETNGVEGLRKVANNWVDALEFIFKIHQKKYKQKTPSSTREFFKSFSKYLTNVDSITKDFYVNKLVSELGISKEIILQEMPFKILKEVSAKKVREEKTKVLQIKTPASIVEKKDISPVEKEITNKKLFNERNYSYALILSMVKNPILVKLYEKRKKEVIFRDASVLAIANFLISLNKIPAQKPEKNLKLKFQEIVENNEYVNTEDEFNELIERINKSSIETSNHVISVKLKDTSNLEEKIRLLEQKRKNKGGKG